MTDQETAVQVAQIEQDNVNLDYYKWSAQQLRLRQPNDHDTWKGVRDATIARQQNENRLARERRLAAEADAKANKAKLDDAAIDLEFEPQKQTLRRQWLVDHPGKSPSDFENQAWPLLKQNLLEQRQAATFEATLADARQRTSGMYSI